jgi:N-acetylmuramoyl-L-alanine amidase
VRILIDPGHGGADPGAFFFNTKESMLNLRLALLLNGYLKDGVGRNYVNLTRTDDVDLPPAARRAVIQGAPYDLFVCIHHNAYNSPTAQGFESFIRREPLAADVPLQAALHTHIKPLLAKWQVPDRGAKRYNFRVMSEKRCPGLFLEIGFMSSPAEYAKLIDRYYQAEWAMALADFIRKL